MTPAYQLFRGGSLFLGHAMNVRDQSAGSLERTGYLLTLSRTRPQAIGPLAASDSSGRGRSLRASTTVDSLIAHIQCENVDMLLPASHDLGASAFTWPAALFLWVRGRTCTGITASSSSWHSREPSGSANGTVNAGRPAMECSCERTHGTKSTRDAPLNSASGECSRRQSAPTSTGGGCTRRWSTLD